MSVFNTGAGFIIKFNEGPPVSRLRFKNLSEMVDYLFDDNGYYEYGLGCDIKLCGMNARTFYKVKDLFEKKLREIPVNVQIYARPRIYDEKPISGYYIINLPWFLDKVKDLGEAVTLNRSG